MKNVHARVLAGLLVGLVTSATALSAYADGPPAGVVTELAPPAAPPTAPVEEPPSSTDPAQSTRPVEFLPGNHPSKIAAYIFAGLAVVGVGVGTTFGILALHNQSNYNANPTGSSLSSANQDSVLADVGLGAAVIAGATSVVLFLKRDEPAPASKGSEPLKHASTVSVTVAPIVSPHEAGAGVVLRF